MLVNFVRVSALAVLNSAKPCLIFTQPPRKGGCQTRPSPEAPRLAVAPASNVCCHDYHRRQQPLSTRSVSLSLSLCRSLLAGLAAVAVVVAGRPPSPSHLSLADGSSRRVVKNPEKPTPPFSCISPVKNKGLWPLILFFFFFLVFNSSVDYNCMFNLATFSSKPSR